MGVSRTWRFDGNQQKKGFLMPYPPVIQFATMRRAVKAELALPKASESARRAPRRLDLRSPLVRRAASQPGSGAEEVKRLEGRFVLTGYRSWR